MMAACGQMGTRGLAGPPSWHLPGVGLHRRCFLSSPGEGEWPRGQPARPSRRSREERRDVFDPLDLSPQYLEVSTKRDGRKQRAGTLNRAKGEDGFDWGEFFAGGLPKKLGIMLLLVAVSRVGVYVRIPGVDIERFNASFQTGGVLSYIDALSGGSISRVSIFSLGIVPYINASIILQLLASSFPSLKKLQREEGSEGQTRFELYQRLLTILFATIQAVGTLTSLRPFVNTFSTEWLFTEAISLIAGSMVLVYVADQITALEVGNGTSILITANIASAVPLSVGRALQQAGAQSSGNLAVYAAAFFATTLGVVYVQGAERKIPINYASAYRNTALTRQSYLPFKVNAAGVMPVIFASSVLALPAAATRFVPLLEPVAGALGPAGILYLPVNVGLIVAFNFYYTFLQLEPKDMAEQLKRQGASIPAVRPGRATSDYITKTLDRMSVLGSLFLGALSTTPFLVEALTKLTAFRGFAGTSLLILVGVATDTARKVSAEQAMQRLGDVDRLYDDMDAK